jgi:hypothetical protein
VPQTDPDPFGLASWKGRYPQGDANIEVVPEFDHLSVFAVGQQALELTARVKPGDRPKVSERNRIAKTIAEGLAREDVGPLSRSVTVLMMPMRGSLLDEWRSVTRPLGQVQTVEAMGTVDYPEKDWATSYLLVRGTRGFRVFTLRWSGMKVSGWGQDSGFPAVRDYYPSPDGSFVSPAHRGVPRARVRRAGATVELAP